MGNDASCFIYNVSLRKKNLLSDERRLFGIRWIETCLLHSDPWGSHEYESNTLKQTASISGKQIRKISKGFPLGDVEVERKLHLLLWCEVCFSIKEGVIGLSRLMLLRK